MERLGKGTGIINNSYYNLDLIANSNETLSTVDFLSRRACESDAIIIGTIKNKQSAITTDEKIIFTKYEVIINQVVKNNLVNPIKEQNHIEIARPGGFILYKDHRIRQTNGVYPSLIKDNTYILFLKYVNQNSGYVSSGFESDFVFVSNSAKLLFSEFSPGDLRGKKDSKILINTLGKSVQINCRQAQKSK